MNTNDFKIDIIQQGAPVVNCGGVFKSGDGFVAIEVDLSSKYCEVSATSGGDVPGIYISANEDSMNLLDSVDRDVDTVIEFPEYAGYNVWCSNISRYTLAVCLVKD